MRKFIIILLLFPFFAVHAQNLRQEKMELPDGSKLTYQTINNELNGIYTIDKEGQNFLRGNYVKDKRVGNWYFFNKDKSLYARYNYDVNKVLFVDDKMLALASVKVLSGNEEINSKASVSFPLFSLEHYFELLTKLAESSVPIEDLYKLDQNSVYIVANVAVDGATTYIVRYEIKEKKKQQKIRVDKNPFYIDWIVSSYEHIPYPSEFIIKVRLNIAKDEGQHKRINWGR